jgi:hypothetical protein
MTSTIRICLVLAAFVLLAGTSSLAQLPIQDIQLFNATALPQTDTNRGDQANSIDGDLGTFSYLTPSFAIGDRFAGLDLGSATSINRLQVTKYSDVDGAGSPVDPMDLQLLYTTDTGPINARHYQPVTGLTNGYLGTEQIVADSVNSADATVVKDITNGTYSLTFDSVSATGLALKYTRDPSGDYIENYYPTAEFKPMNGTTPHAASGIDIWRPAMPARSVNVARGTMFGALPTDQDFAIDGDTNTWTYLTRSFTDSPTAITLDLGGATAVNRIRVDKVSNQVTGEGFVVPMDVQILYTTDTGPMNQRTFHPVSGLHNGYGGTELIHADSVDSSTATVHKEIAQFSTDGWFSLTFGEVNATAIEYLISKPDGSVNQYVNYPIAEFQLYDSAIVGVPGDYNNNGVVDMADYVIWRNSVGQSTLNNRGTGITGTVGQADYNFWRAHFGATSGSGSGLGGSASVPEPGLAILVTLGGMIALVRRRTASK